MREYIDENSLDGGLTNAGQGASPEDGASLGDGATYAGGQKKSWSDISLGGGSTIGGKLGDQETVIDDIEVVDLEARYKVEGTLGRGGMGEVLLALDTRLDRKVAIKRILGEAARSKTAVERFLTEAKSVAAINHPNVVQIFDYGRAKDGPFLIMEYVDGSSLLDRCRDGALPVEEAIDLACQLCDGLGKAHDLGIVHRDIKPANVLLTQDGVPKLTDFGLAKAEASDHQMTVTGAVLGTPDFMPPEQRRDAAEVDARSDLWSLAATLYQMVTGRSPKIIRFDLLPDYLTGVLGTALEETKDDRFQTARDLRDALKASQAATTSEASELGEGQCPACGVKNDSSRRFCRGCGESLEAPCLSCEKPMPMWEEICGQCGSKQAPLVEQRRGALAAKKAEAEGLLKESRFEEAESIGVGLRDEADPRLKQLVPWATEFLPQITAKRDAALRHAATLLQEAAKHEAAHDYPSALSTLALIPEVLRQRSLPGNSETAGAMVARVSATQAAIKRLESHIKEQVRQRQFVGLITEVERLAALCPERRDVAELLAKLRDRDTKFVQQRDDAVRQAKELLEAKNYAATIAVLKKIDSSVVNEEVRQLRSRAEKLLAELRRLLEVVKKARAEEQYEGLIDTVEQAIDLSADDEGLTKILQSLRAREEKISTEIQEIVAEADAAISCCDYRRAHIALCRVPVSLRDEAILSRLEIAELLGIYRAGFEEAIAKLPQTRNLDKLENVALAGLAKQGRSYLAAAAEHDVVDQPVVEWCERLEAAIATQGAAAIAAEKAKDNIRRLLVAAGVVAAVVLVLVVGLSIRSAWQATNYQAAIVAERWQDALRIDPTSAEAFLGMARHKLAASPPDVMGAFSDIDRAERNGAALALLAPVKGSAHAARAIANAQTEQIDAAMAELKTAESLGAVESDLAVARKAIGSAWQTLVIRHAESKQFDVAAADLKAAERMEIPVSDRIAARTAIGAAWRSQVLRRAEVDQLDEAVVLFQSAKSWEVPANDVTAARQAIGVALLARVTLYLATDQIGEAIAETKAAEQSGLEEGELSAINKAIGAGWRKRVLRYASVDQINEATGQLADAVKWGLQGDDVSASREAIGVAWVARAKSALTKKDTESANAAMVEAGKYGIAASMLLPIRTEVLVVEAGNKLQGGEEDAAVEMVLQALAQSAEAAVAALGRGVYSRDLKQRFLQIMRGMFDKAITEERWGEASRLAKRASLVDQNAAGWLGFAMEALSEEAFASMSPETISSLPLDVLGSLPPRVTASLPPLRNSIGIDLKLLPAGTFTMGDAEGKDSETPHPVTLTQPFYLGVTEVTNAQWKAVMGSVPSNWKDAKCPVEQVSWEAAVTFCEKLSALPAERAAGRVYRLPTEAEWEYACRAGSSTAYCFGNHVAQLKRHAWFSDNLRAQTHSVGQKQPNAWGLYDMHGNVFEWCSDWYGDYPRGDATAMDPRGPARGSDRVDRGGSWYSLAGRCRSAYRGRSDPSLRDSRLGFRLALSPSGVEPPEALTSERRPGGSMAEPATAAAGASNDAQLLASGMPSTVTNSVDVKLKLISAGTFVMGDGSDAHEVTLTQPFYLGVTEVTNAQWQAVMGSVPSKWQDADHPVEQVRWDDAVAFCKKLSAMPDERAAGREYRLPTEAEWEYACRAGTTTQYSFGDDESLLGDFAWFSGNASRQTHPVGQKRPNAWGLYDMHGNVWEWCSDWDGEYPGGAATNPRGPSKGSLRVARGGSWSNPARYCRSAIRWGYPSSRSNSLGFRLALSPSGVKPPEAGK